MAKVKLIRLSVENKPGTVAAAIASLAQAGVNIISVFGWSPQGVLELAVDNARTAASTLKKLGIPFTEGQAEIVKLPNTPGALHRYLGKLAAKGVNLRSLNGCAGKDSDSVLVAWTAEA